MDGERARDADLRDEVFDGAGDAALDRGVDARFGARSESRFDGSPARDVDSSPDGSFDGTTGTRVDSTVDTHSDTGFDDPADTRRDEPERSEDRDESDLCADVRAEFVNLWGRMGGFWGVPPTTARVYGYLLSLDHAASSDELITGLAMSRGAVSMACRELRDWGLIHPEHEPGSRQVRWRPETDLEKAIRNIVAARKRREWDPILEHLREWIPRLEAENSPEAAVFRERLRSIESLVGAADAMAESFLQGGLVKSLGLKMLVASARAEAARAAKRRPGARRDA